MLSYNGSPYVIPVNFVYDGDSEFKATVEKHTSRTEIIKLTITSFRAVNQKKLTYKTGIRKNIRTGRHASTHTLPADKTI